MQNPWLPLQALTIVTLSAMVFGINSCTSEPTEEPPPVVLPKDSTGKGMSYGTFQVSLVSPTDFNPAGYSVISGKLFNGVNPSTVNWKASDSVGSCVLLIPFTPTCSTPCGSNALCVDKNVCQEFPEEISVGAVTVSGLTYKTGSDPFVMNPINKFYQQPSNVSLVFPPFTPGQAVSMVAEGDSVTAAFTLNGQGITPLDMVQDTIQLADGMPIQLQWTAGASTQSVISLVIDISHHGGTKGKISCEGPDNGSMEIAATLVSKLKALGMAGYPKMDISRKSITAPANNHVELVLESGLSLPLNIPGLISCGDDSECPDGQTCQDILICK